MATEPNVNEKIINTIEVSKYGYSYRAQNKSRNYYLDKNTGHKNTDSNIKIND